MYLPDSIGVGYGPGGILGAGFYATAALATSAWSFRKVVRDYVGNCVQLSNGVTHVDVGWLPEDANGEIWLDGYTAADAIAAGYTGIRTLYDQAGVVDLTQRSFSLVTNPISLDLSATPMGRPAIVFGVPTAGENALHDNTNAGSLSNIFSGGGTMLFAGSFNSSATSASYVWSKGASNYHKYHNSTTMRFGTDRATTNGVFHKSSFPATAGDWWTTLMTYDEDNVANVPKWKVETGTYATGSVTTTPVGAKDTDAASKFSLGNRATGASGAMSGYISEFTIWDYIL